MVTFFGVTSFTSLTVWALALVRLLLPPDLRGVSHFRGNREFNLCEQVSRRARTVQVGGRTRRVADVLARV